MNTSFFYIKTIGTFYLQKRKGVGGEWAQGKGMKVNIVDVIFIHL
jgi:hypothetical protein